MKNFVKILLAFVMLMAIGLGQSTTVQAQDKYDYGFRTAVDVPITDTVMVEIAPLNISQMLASVALDTSVTVNVNVANSIPNDWLILKLTADETNRHVTFGDNITAIADSVIATKTKTFAFVFDGTAFIQVGEIQIE